MSLDPKSDDFDPFLVRRYVFERLNTGGKPLNAQEIRNSLYRGPFNELITKLTRDNTFCRIFGIPQYTEVDQTAFYENPERKRNNLYRTMADCQIVLRFFALLDEEHISGSMKSILDNCMERNKDATPEALNSYEQLFNRLIETASQIFGDETFLLPADEKGNRRISVAMYDSIMVALSKRMARLEEFVQKREQIKTALAAAFQNEDIANLLVGKANTAQAIKDRIGVVGTILDNIAHA